VGRKEKLKFGRSQATVAIKRPERIEVEKFFPRETELEKLRNARVFFLKEKIWVEKPARFWNRLICCSTLR